MQPPPSITTACSGGQASVTTGQSILAGFEGALCTDLKNRLGVSTLPPQPPTTAIPAVYFEYALLAALLALEGLFT